jgi:hypothetical protein
MGRPTLSAPVFHVLNTFLTDSTPEACRGLLKSESTARRDLLKYIAQGHVDTPCVTQQSTRGATGIGGIHFRNTQEYPNIKILNLKPSFIGCLFCLMRQEENAGTKQKRVKIGLSNGRKRQVDCPIEQCPLIH